MMDSELMYRNYNWLEVTVARIYLYLLPFRMIVQLSFLQNIAGGAATYLDLLLHGLGMLLLILNSDWKLNIGKDAASKLMQYFVIMVTIFNLSSLFMAFVIQFTYGNQGSESAFNGIMGMLLYFIQYALILFYNKNIFRMLTGDEIIKIMQHICIFLLVLGYWQIAILNGNETLTDIMNVADIFEILYPEATMPKLSLTTSEGAHAGNLIGIFVLPFLFSGVIANRKKKSCIIQIILWLPVIYFTHSTAAYILTVVCFGVFFLLSLKEGSKKKWAVIFAVMCAFFIFLVITLPEVMLSIFPEETREEIEYLLLHKATDFANGSTVSRLVPFVINWGAFTEYPIFGVGNGLQGYFYSEYFPEWAHNVAGSDAYKFLLVSREQISNGAMFFPSLLSGYGIIGITLVVIYIVKAGKLVKAGKKELGRFYYMYHMACWSILITGLQSDFYGRYYLWFMLSIPYMVTLCGKQSTQSDRSINTVSKTEMDKKTVV